MDLDSEQLLEALKMLSQTIAEGHNFWAAILISLIPTLIVTGLFTGLNLNFQKKMFQKNKEWELEFWESRKRWENRLQSRQERLEQERFQRLFVFDWIKNEDSRYLNEIETINKIMNKYLPLFEDTPSLLIQRNVKIEVALKRVLEMVELSTLAIKENLLEEHIYLMFRGGLLEKLYEFVPLYETKASYDLKKICS